MEGGGWLCLSPRDSRAGLRCKRMRQEDHRHDRGRGRDQYHPVEWGGSHMSTGGRVFVSRGGHQSNGRGRGWNGTGMPVVMQQNIATEETVKALVPPVTTTRSNTPFATSPLEECAQSASTQVPTCMYCGQRGHWMMWCAERLANKAKTMAVARGGTEVKGGAKHPN